MKNFLIKLGSLVSMVALFPLPALAASCFDDYQSGGKLGDLFNYVTCTINNTVIPLIFAIAIVMFIWGVIQFVLNADDAEKKAKGRDFMIWGILGLTVMVGVWGLVKIVGATFGVRTNVLPQVNPSNQSNS